jgi:hypothetical protein
MPYLILSAIGPEFPPEDNDIGPYFLRANSWSVTPDNFRAEYKLAQNVADRLSPVKTVATFDVAAEGNPNLRKGVTKTETLADVKLVEPEPDYRVVGWRWAEGYGTGGERYWLLPRQLKLSDGTYIEIEELKRG